MSQNTRPVSRDGSSESVEHQNVFSESKHEKQEGVQVHSGGVDLGQENINAVLANPLAGIPQEQLMLDGENFARQYGLGHLTNEFQKGAILAQDPFAFEGLNILNQEEKDALMKEQTHRWHQPFTLYWLVVMCSIAAAVQGVSCVVYHQVFECS